MNIFSFLLVFAQDPGVVLSNLDCIALQAEGYPLPEQRTSRRDGALVKEREVEKVGTSYRSRRSEVDYHS